jgi:uncharacterized spore protein YtfJ
MSATRLIEGALDKVRATAGVKTVYGEPIKVDGKTIIPIAKMAHGAGAGAPVGVVEISEGETKFVAINSKKKVGIAAAVGAAAGMLAGLFMGRGRRRGD